MSFYSQKKAKQNVSNKREKNDLNIRNVDSVSCFSKFTQNDLENTYLH